MENPISLAIGDVVKWAASENAANKEEVVITDVSYDADTDVLSYSVDGSAWYYGYQLVFVRRANMDSLKRVRDLMLAESAEEEDELSEDFKQGHLRLKE